MPAEITPGRARNFIRDGMFIRLSKNEVSDLEKDHTISAVYQDIDSSYGRNGYKGGFRGNVDGGMTIKFYSGNRAVGAADLFIDRGLKEEIGNRPTRDDLAKRQR